MKTRTITFHAVYLAILLLSPLPSLANIEFPAPETLLEELLENSSRRESREGIATYYAKRFEGRRTTSGVRYNPEKMTAAHPRLPLGSVVRVVNASNGREVVVTINDRCRSRSFQIIDLSRAAAQKIGLYAKGKGKVVIIPLLDSDEG